MCPHSPLHAVMGAAGRSTSPMSTCRASGAIGAARMRSRTASLPRNGNEPEQRGALTIGVAIKLIAI